MATELERLFLEMALIHIEQKMLLIQMLKCRAKTFAEVVCPNNE